MSGSSYCWSPAHENSKVISGAAVIQHGSIFDCLGYTRDHARESVGTAPRRCRKHIRTPQSGRKSLLFVDVPGQSAREAHNMDWCFRTKGSSICVPPSSSFLRRQTCHGAARSGAKTVPPRRPALENTETSFSGGCGVVAAS